MRRTLIIGAVTAASIGLSAGGAFAAGSLVGDYGLRDSYASSVGGSPDLVPLSVDAKTGSFAPDTVNGQSRDDYQFAANQGLQANVGTQVTDGSYSIVLLVRVDALDGARGNGYVKLVDFKDQSSDAGLYYLNGQLDFYNDANSGSTVVTAGTFHQVVLTRTAAGQVTGYLDGVPQLTFADAGGDAVPLQDFRLLADDAHTAGGESAGGAVAHVQIYDDALTAVQVAALPVDPGTSTPPTSLPEAPFAVGLPLAGAAVVGVVGRRRRRTPR